MLDGVKHSHSFNMKLSLWVKTVLLLAFVVIFLIPFFYMFGSAFKTNAEISSYPPSILPGEIYTGNFNTLNETAPFSTFFKNSLKMAAVSAVGVVVTSTLAGFIFSKYKFRANKLLFGLIFATSMIPFEMYMVPLYINMVDLGFGNTFVGIVSPYIIMSFGIFFMRQICSQQIPDDLLDAARIDGCSEIQIFIKIVFPLLKSAIAALAILAFVEGWNAFVWPLIMAQNNNLFTMEVGLALFQTTFNVDLGAVAAGSLCSVAPILIVFLVFRRQIMESIAMTGLKG